MRDPVLYLKLCTLKKEMYSRQNILQFQNSYGPVVHFLFRFTDVQNNLERKEWIFIKILMYYINIIFSWYCLFFSLTTSLFGLNVPFGGYEQMCFKAIVNSDSICVRYLYWVWGCRNHLIKACLPHICYKQLHCLFDMKYGNK